MADLIKKFKFTIIPVLILSIFFFILYFNQNINSKFKKHILSKVEEFSSRGAINREIKNVLNILNTAAYTLSDEDLSNLEETVKDFNTIIEKNNFKNMAITTINGIAYVNTGEIINVSDRDYFKNSINGENFVSSIVSSKIDNKKSNVYSVPIIKNDKIVGVLWASMYTETFYKSLNLDSINESGSTFIIDQDGTLIVGEEILGLNYENLNFFNEIALSKNNNYNYSRLQKIKEDFSNYTNGCIDLKYKDDIFYIYYVKIPYNNWWIITSISDKLIENSYTDIIQFITEITMFLFLLLIILVIILLRNEKNNNNKFKLIAYTDNITEGKNELFLKDNINKLIKKNGNFVFISLEIININTIINISGFKTGEFILKKVYKYIDDMLYKDEIVIHSYLGEYKLLLKYNNLSELTQRLDSINFNTINESIDFKMGIYLIDKSDINFENMCLYVNIAKENLNNGIKYVYYTKKMHKREIEKINLENDIKNGIENKEFKAWFQPKYGKDGKSIVGAESLVRWHKYGTIISPYIFIPICEANGLIKEIDELVFEYICNNIRLWLNENKKVVPISVNLSRSYLNKVNFIDTLEKYIDKYKIPKNLIQFEITESSLIENQKKLKDIVSLLHEKGFKVLLDDFGVGYSSIKSISDVNFDILKIDKSFIDGIGQSKWEYIIKYTINLANKLGMDVIAEGVETEEQYKFLLNCNCYIFQGYYFNKPMNATDFSKLL